MNAEQREARVVELVELIDDIYVAVEKSRFGNILIDQPVTPSTLKGKALDQVAFSVFSTLLSNMCPKSPSRLLQDTQLDMRHRECGS